MDFPILVMVVIFGFSISSIYLLVHQVKLSPLIEMKILLLAVILIIIHYLMGFISLYLIDPSSHVIFLMVYKSQFFLRYLAITLITLILFLPAVSVRYRDIFFIVLFTIGFTLTGAIIINTIEVDLTHTFPSVLFSPITVPFRILTGLLVIFVLSYRFNQIDQVQKNSKIEKVPIYQDFVVLLIIITAIIIVNSQPSINVFLSGLNLLITSLGVLYFSYMIYRNRYFLFISNFKIDGIAISEQKTQTTKVVFGSESVKNQIVKFVNTEMDPIKKLIGLGIESDQDLEFISFGTQEISIFNGNGFSAIIISSNPNLIGKQLIKAIAKGVKEYDQKSPGKIKLESRLHQIIEDIINYAPLSMY